MSSSLKSSGSLILDMVLKVDGDQQEAFLQHGMTIGRATSNTICIDSPDVEHIHARVLRSGDGRLYIRAETTTARLGLMDGSSAQQVELGDQARFRIGTKTLVCIKQQTRTITDVVVTDNPWRVQCPICYASIAQLPVTENICPHCSSPLVYFRTVEGSQFDGWLPRRVGPYNIRAYVGRGGMGVVLRGLHNEMDMPAAIKLMRFADTPDLTKRFLQEADTLKSLTHPNIVTLQQHGQDNRMLWLAMDWIDGQVLTATIAQAQNGSEHVSVQEIADILTQTARGLHYLHTNGIVHRDLKPQNILRSRDKLIKIVDFGLALQSDKDVTMATMLTRTGVVVGTAGYMSPEQLSGEKLTPAADMFCLGLIAYELFTGKRLLGVMDSIASHRSGCPGGWQELIASCLNTNPRLRPSAQEFLVRMKRIEDGVSWPSDPSSGNNTNNANQEPQRPAQPIRPRPRSKPKPKPGGVLRLFMWLLMGLLIFLMIIAGGVLGLAYVTNKDAGLLFKDVAEFVLSSQAKNTETPRDVDVSIGDELPPKAKEKPSASVTEDNSEKVIAEWLRKQPIGVNEILSENYVISEKLSIVLGANLMSFAAIEGRVDVMEWLARHEVSPTAKDARGTEPIFYAACMNQVAALAWLKNNGADPRAQSSNGTTVVHFAALGNSVQALQWLRDNGADLTSWNSGGLKATHFAAIGDSVHALQWLKESGADLDIRSNNGATIVHLAAICDSIHVLQWLKDNGIDLHAKDNAGTTAVHVAAQAGRISALEWLKNNDAVLYAQDNDGLTAMHYAARGDSDIALQWLKENAVDLHAKNNAGATAMHFAALTGSVSALEWLKKNDAVLYEHDNGGSTAIHYAAQGDSITALQWLKDNDASLNARNNYGASAVHFAALSGGTSALQWLKENGVDLHAQDNNGETAKQWAEQQGQTDAVLWLEANDGNPEFAPLDTEETASSLRLLVSPSSIVERKKENMVSAMTALRAYATAQITFQVGRQGSGNHNSQTGHNGFADNFRNLYYGNPRLSNASSDNTKNLELIGKAQADAFVIQDYRTKTVESPKIPSEMPVPYRGYLFFEDQSIENWAVDFAMFAVPESPDSGDLIFWIDINSGVFMRLLQEDDYSNGIPRIDIQSPRIEPQNWEAY